jgi:hypothetical protein
MDDKNFMKKNSYLNSKIIVFVCCFFMQSYLMSYAQEGRHILKQGYTAEFFQQNILEPTAWVPYPAINKSNEWKSILSAQKYTAIIKTAESLIGYSWPTPRASVFLDFVENGNRTNFETISFSRRNALSNLVIGELIENKGRFMDDIVDGIWSICEETFWGVPAHLTYQNRGVGLADVTNPVVDLFAAETGSMLAWVSNLLGDKLDKVSPLIKERIYIEIDRRIFKVIESNPKYRWMGFNRKNTDTTLSYRMQSFQQRRPNNWNPWISSNLLTCTLLLEKNKQRRSKFVQEVFNILDNYLDPYPADGGCDEGPSYWGKAAAATFDCLDLVSMATNNKFNLFGDTLIKNMGEYIFKAYIGNGYYLNFADAVAKTNHSPMLIYRYGKAVNSKKMMEMGAFLASQDKANNNLGDGFSLLRNLPEIFYSKNLLNTIGQEPLILDSWLPDIQVMVSRDQANTKTGFTLAAKAGHNQESHNHNDVGSFMLFYNGYPTMIDAGAGTYTKDYNLLWVHSSAYHNFLPIINGNVQEEGRKYSASNVSYSNHLNQVLFSQDISKTYHDTVGVIKWETKYRHQKGKSITIAQAYELKENPSEIVIPILLATKPDISTNGQLIITTGDGEKIVVDYDSKLFMLSIEEIKLADDKIARNWGATIFRACFKMSHPSKKGNYTFGIKNIKTALNK